VASIDEYCAVGHSPYGGSWMQHAWNLDLEGRMDRVEMVCGLKGEVEVESAVLIDVCSMDVRLDYHLVQDTRN
jgi:hypothetical protein